MYENWFVVAPGAHSDPKGSLIISKPGGKHVWDWRFANRWVRLTPRKASYKRRDVIASKHVLSIAQTRNVYRIYNIVGANKVCEQGMADFFEV